MKKKSFNTNIITCILAIILFYHNLVFAGSLDYLAPESKVSELGKLTARLRESPDSARRGYSRREVLAILAGTAVAVAVGVSKTTRAQEESPQDEIPDNISKVEIKSDPDGYRFYINGVKSDGLPGMCYQPVPNKKRSFGGYVHVNEFIRDNGYSGLYKALLDKDEGGMGHAAILYRMGVKIIRIYELDSVSERDLNSLKRIFQKVYEKYGIMVLAGTYVGLYEDPNNMEEVRQNLYDKVMDFAFEPWILGWQIGNENDLYLSGQKLAATIRNPIKMERKEYYTFMDELAGLVKSADKTKRPVFFGHSDPGHDLLVYGMIADMRNIDGVGINAYRDEYGFRELFRIFRREALKRKKDLPVVISEFGSSVLEFERQGVSRSEAEARQLAYNQGIWRVIRGNTAGYPGYGNVLAGFCFIFTDQLFRLSELPPEEHYQAYFGVLGRPAQAMFKLKTPEKVVYSEEEPSESLVWKSYTALEAGDLDTAIDIAGIILTRHKKQAEIEQKDIIRRVASGESFNYVHGRAGSDEMKRKIFSFGSLNMTGAALLVMGRACRGQRQYIKCRKYLKLLTDQFYHAQVWSDGGFFWKPADEAKKELEVVSLFIVQGLIQFAHSKDLDTSI